LAEGSVDGAGSSGPGNVAFCVSEGLVAPRLIGRISNESDESELSGVDSDSVAVCDAVSDDAPEGSSRLGAASISSGASRGVVLTSDRVDWESGGVSRF